MSADKRHLNEHEAGAGLAPPPKNDRGAPFHDAKAGVRAALRYKLGLVGTTLTDERMYMTDEAFDAALKATLGHSPELPQKILPMTKPVALPLMGPNLGSKSAAKEKE
jgi:hypothetical protein